MIQVAGKPFLEHEINLLRRTSIDEIVICIGYRGETIRNHFKDGRSFGVRIKYSDDGQKLLGTAGSLKNAGPILSDLFFITFGDAYPILDYKAAWSHFLSTRKNALMVVNRNFDQHGRSNAVVKDGLVTFYSKMERALEMDYIEFGVTFMDKRALEAIPNDYPVDLEVPYRKIIAENQMAALEVKQRTYDIGSLEGLAEFRELAETRQIQL